MFMQKFFLILLLFLPGFVTAELRILDESGLTRAVHHTERAANIRLSIESSETNNIHVKLVNIDGLAEDIETICYEKELLIPSVDQGSWQIMLQPKTAVITQVAIEEQKED